MRRSVHAVLVFVQASFAAFHVFGKHILHEVDPMVLAALRVSFAAPILFAAAWFVERHRPAWRDLLHLSYLGLFGVCLNQLLFIHGLERTTATNAAILMPAIPAFSAALAILFRVERLSWLRGLGIASATLGAIVLVDPTQFELDSDTAVGNLLVLLNCLSYALFVVLQRPVLERVPPLTLTAWAYVFGGLGVLVVAGPTLVATDLTSYAPLSYAGIAYILIVPTTLNYALVTWAIRRSSPTLVSTYITMQPMFAATFARIFLGEAIGLHQLAGFVLIVVGLLLVIRSRQSS
ncbi:MAG: DMT family transporter [Deltaproteobacteria bacterium]